MRTAKEMAEYCKKNNTGTGFSKGQRLKHFKVVESNLQDDEEVLGCFCGIHNYKSMTEHSNNFGYAITNKRIILGQKKVMGENVHIISRKNINDVAKSTGLAFGTITFDTIKETFNVRVEKKETDAIHTLLVHQLFNEDSPNTLTTEKSAVEQLKEYKELLDMDIITQEEFDAKKKDLLS